MRLHVDGWNPGYGPAFEPAESATGPSAQSSAQVGTDVELPASAWRPLNAPGDVRAPGTVLLVDGVRRRDAGAWITDDEGVTHPAAAASFAAGVVRCDLRRGVAEVATARVERGLFTTYLGSDEVSAGAVRYPIRRVGEKEAADPMIAVQRHLAALEVEVSGRARDADDFSGDDLLVVDGPLRGRAHLPRALGYVKTHRSEYLPPELSNVVTSLAAGQRCPVFLLGTSWHRYAWYVRLPGPEGAPWTGIVRAECAAELTLAEAIALADRSVVTLPRFASTSYKDPRAPQNLVPIAGLERRLKAMLGDARLLHRALTLASRRTPVRSP